MSARVVTARWTTVRLDLSSFPVHSIHELEVSLLPFYGNVRLREGTIQSSCFPHWSLCSLYCASHLPPPCCSLHRTLSCVFGLVVQTPTSYIKGPGSSPALLLTPVSPQCTPWKAAGDNLSNWVPATHRRVLNRVSGC